MYAFSDATPRYFSEITFGKISAEWGSSKTLLLYI